MKIARRRMCIPRPRPELEATEGEIVARYSDREVKAIRRHGFTGLSVAERAAVTNNSDLYNIVYRNFSRDIHSTDYVEYRLRLGVLPEEQTKDYWRSRDRVTVQTAVGAVGTVLSGVNGAHSCGLAGELEELRAEAGRLGERSKPGRSKKESLLARLS